MPELTEKEMAIRDVLSRRIEIIQEKILPNCKEKTQREYYTGKIHGLEQAYELLGETLACIRVEL